MKRAAEAARAEGMQDEANRLIREWLDPRRVPTEEEIRAVLAHVAQAPFASRPVPVDKSIRGRVFQGRRLADREPSIIAHLAKRVLVNRQWAVDVRPAEFLRHLHSAVVEGVARRCIYIGRDKRCYSSVLAPNRLPVARLGPDARPLVWVVYTTDYGTIVTGYQVTGLEEITLPEQVRWL